MNRYERVKLLCCFDLPTDTNEEKKEYRNFRKALIENGFFMMQYSVYVRTCPNRDFAKKFEGKLRQETPKNGNIRLLCITEKQYDDMVLILGMKSEIEEVVTAERIIVI